MKTKIEITYLGINANQFKYRVTVHGNDFAFFTGLGWNSIGKKNPDPEKYSALKENEQEAVKSTMPWKTRDYVFREVSTRVWRRKPTAEDVAECLISDAEAGKMSFDEFCDNFGYSSDSLKALDTYRQCMDTAKKLRGVDLAEFIKAQGA